MSLNGRLSSQRECECGHNEGWHYIHHGDKKGEPSKHNYKNIINGIHVSPWWLPCKCMKYCESLESRIVAIRKNKKRKKWREQQEEWHKLRRMPL